MRYFAAFESYVLVLYKWKTSSNKHAHVLVPSHGGRGHCVTGQNNAEKETKVCMEQMKLRDNEQMCAFISDKLEVFLSYSPFLPFSLLCKNRFLAFKKCVLLHK